MLYKIQTIYHFYHGIFKILIVSQNYVSTHLQRQRTYRKKKNREKIRILFLERVLSKTPKAFEKKKGKKK